MRIIIDAMGGDYAPAEIVKGAVDAANEFGVDITLVGRRADIEAHLPVPNEHIDIAEASDIVTMEDDPATAVRRKKDSSMAVALRMLAEEQGDACISAGSTGALLTGATLLVRRIHGIRRAAMAPVIPNGGKGTVLIDCGANVECTPEYMLQFAFMGSFYAKNILGCSEPRIGLLNIGTEDTKGTELCRQAYALLKQASEAGRINFVGNVEGRDAMSGNVDVLVCDGFSGNVLLKGTEGAMLFMMKQLKGIFMSGITTKLAALMVRGGIGRMKKMLDPKEVGGTAMLGISKPVFKAHGNSDARAIRSAVMRAMEFVEAGVIDEIVANIGDMKVEKQDNLQIQP